MSLRRTHAAENHTGRARLRGRRSTSKSTFHPTLVRRPAGLSIEWLRGTTRRSSQETVDRSPASGMRSDGEWRTSLRFESERLHPFGTGGLSRRPRRSSSTPARVTTAERFRCSSASRERCSAMACRTWSPALASLGVVMVWSRSVRVVSVVVVSRPLSSPSSANRTSKPARSKTSLTRQRYNC